MRFDQDQQDDDYYCYDGDEQDPEETADTSVGVAFFAAGAYEPGF
jgi:hypothetical protein